MSIKYTAECDLCGKREENQYKEGTPDGWYHIGMIITDCHFPDENFRNTSFDICPVCYPPEFAQQDIKHNNSVPIYQPSPKLKDIFKKSLTKLKNMLR
jgi:hypothetical protein